MRILAYALAGLGSLVAAAGCGDTQCGGNDRSGDDRAPTLNDFSLLDREIPGDPWTILLAASFADNDGNLEGGKASFYLNNDDNATTQDLIDVFRQSGVPANATEGEIWMALRFSPTVKDGAEVRLGLQLSDAGGNLSNCYTLDLSFDVKEVAGYLQPPRVEAHRGRCLRG